MVRRIPEDEWPLPTRVVCDSAEEVAQAIATLPEYGEAVIIEHNGKRVAAIIPMDDLELYQRLFAEEEDRIDIAAIEATRAEGGEPVPWEQIKAEWAAEVANALPD